MARGRRIVVDSSDDEFPDLADILSFKAKAFNKSAGSVPTKTDQPGLKNAARRRRLGVIADNPLLRPLSDRRSSTLAPKEAAPKKKNCTTPQRVELRTRKANPIATSAKVDDHSEAGSIQEETIIEDFSEDDDDGSDFEENESSAKEEEEDDSTFGEALQRSSSWFKRIGMMSQESRSSSERKRSPSPSAQLLAEALEAEERNDTRRSGSSRKGTAKSKAFTKGEGSEQWPSSTDIIDPLSKLRIHEIPPPMSSEISRPITPTSPEPKFRGLVSPSKKISHIPATPHLPQMDTFWDQEFIDEWNDEYSPKKQLFSPSDTNKSPSKKAGSPRKRGEPSQAAVQKSAKKAFLESKHEVADKFLRELDERITEGKLSELSAGTGGIRIEWTNKLNTTAGRANWKRETIKSKAQDGEAPSVRYRHHASIELSTKVIDDTHRLLNVIAHEFCHLANFMVSGVTNNPHGREFKAWAAQVTRAFGDDRGIEVTTKHAYDIDFKYVWECTLCGIEFKRHSKSINPERHRCGACKSELRQTKPVPRVRPGKESEYQRFMKKQMRVIKEENPGSLQKDIMRMVASRWSQREKERGDDGGNGTPSSASFSQASAGKGRDAVGGVSKRLDHLTILNLT